MSCTVPIYLINLPRDTQRLAVMAQQLHALQLPFHQVQAVYGKDLSEAQQEQLYDAAANAARYHQVMTLGEIGCYASHLAVWQQLADGSAPLAMVLEDDVLLLPQLPAVLESLAQLPPRWDMIKLVGREREKPWQRWTLQAPAVGTDLIRYHRPPSLTGAYLLSRDGAIKLLAAHSRFYRPIDVDLRHWWRSGLRLYGLWPYPVSLGDESLVSTIGQRELGQWWARRWRKALGQWTYTLRNAWANLHLSRQGNPFPELERNDAP
ncbi:glycosyltransferase family 25 protein [Roseateles sp. BYS180W]|uniref:Glycosyltransferase family 25 protein n=1 Tax=Roseateles rivi TaxID=3299028 RepID=A0ABW7FY31_9BURK